jgi:hypothetical protein
MSLRGAGFATKQSPLSMGAGSLTRSDIQMVVSKERSSQINLTPFYMAHNERIPYPANKLF